MDLDNSAMKEWKKCQKYFLERRIVGIEPKVQSEPLSFGTRVHQLLEEWFKGQMGGSWTAPPTTLSEELEAEAQVLVAGYKARYPEELYRVIDVERGFAIDIPGTSHRYTGKIDVMFEGPGDRITIMDHKTERRGSKDNTPESYTCTTQASLYPWAAEIYYGKEVD